VPRNHEDLDPTVAMPRIEIPPPARAGTYHVAGPIEEAVVVGPAPPSAPPLKPVGVRFPVGNPLAYSLARFAAFAIDVALVTGVLTILAYALIAINPITGLPTNSQRGFDVTLLMGVALALVYVVTFEALFGTTLGKLAFGLHVHALTDRRVGFARAFVRMLLRPVDALLIGGMMTLMPAHRRLGDYAAGTVVTRESPLRRFAPYVGWIGIVIVAGIPVVLVGLPRTFAGLAAFYQFLPHIITRIADVFHQLTAGLTHR
jgi:uncharacterized RDD family membrane protein YckC